MSGYKWSAYLFACPHIVYHMHELNKNIVDFAWEMKKNYFDWCILILWININVHEKFYGYCENCLTQELNFISE